MASSPTSTSFTFSTFTRFFQPSSMAPPASPISPTYSDPGSAHSAPSPSPFSSGSTSTSSTSFTGLSDQPPSLFDSSCVENGLASLYPTDLPSTYPTGGVASDYSAFMGPPPTDYMNPTPHNDCSNYITWSPKNPAQTLSDNSSNNSYHHTQQGQHITDATSPPANTLNSTAAASGTKSTAIRSPSSSSSSHNLDTSNGPIKPSMLGQLYIPQTQPSSIQMSASSNGPVLSPAPSSRYHDSDAVSGGQHQSFPAHWLSPPQQHQTQHQRHSSTGSASSNGGHPILFDVDLEDWHPAQPRHQPQHLRYSAENSPSVSASQILQSQSFHPQAFARNPPSSNPGRSPSHHHTRSLPMSLNLNMQSSTSPASSLSSLSPGQISLPLTPGHEFGLDYGMSMNGGGVGLASSGPPDTPMAASMIIPSPVVVPSSYPGLGSPAGHSPVVGPNNSQAFLNQKRANLGLAQPGSPNTSVSPTTRHNAHPYAQSYQQRSAHGRPSPLQTHQIQQQARRSPLHREFLDDSAPENGRGGSVGIPVEDDYAGQYERMYRERQRQVELRRMERSRETANSGGAKQALVEHHRRHSAPLTDMPFLFQHDNGYRAQPSPTPLLLGEIGRRPNAETDVHHHHQQQQQQQRYGNPNAGGYAPGQSTSPSSGPSSRTVPQHAPSLSTSSSTSSIGSHPPSLPEQIQHQLPGLAVVQHNGTRLLNEMYQGPLTSIPTSFYEETAVSEGDVRSMLELGIDDKGLSRHRHQNSFDMDLGGMDMMDVDAHQGPLVSGADLNPGLEEIMRLGMEMSMEELNGHHPASSAPMGSSSTTNVYMPPMSITVDMNDLTDHNNGNQGISPTLMMLDERGGDNASAENNRAATGDYEFDSVLHPAPSPTLVGSLGGTIPDWQKAGREYDSADSSSDSESEASGRKARSNVEDKDGKDETITSTTKLGADGEAAVAASGTVKARREGGKTDSAGENAGSTADRKVGITRSGTMKQRASTRTITSARSTRNKASTQTLTPHSANNMQVDNEGVASVESTLGDEDADGEDEVLNEEGDEDAVGEDESDEENLSSSDESYDDDKDGEFVLRSRSRSKGATVSRSNSKRTSNGQASAGTASVSAPAGGRARTAGRSLRSRGSGNGRYNPYSIYAATVVSANSSSSAQQGGATAPSTVVAMRTLSAPSIDAGVSDRSASPSVTGSNDIDSHSPIDPATGKKAKAKPGSGLPVPVPVPNLTKKSRGRRVPTVSSLEELRKTGVSQASTSSSATPTGRKGRVGTGAKGTRMYLCDVEGCGKCFARGEHLKRHVRSIHTNEKPHTCPYPGCGKEFSRHDNLGQHMRVHKDFVPPASALKA